MTKKEKCKCSCFEWIQLIISVSIPAVIAIYTVLENDRELAIATHNRIQDLEIADNQQKDAILRDYQKTISKLIEKYGPQLNESESIILLARFATLSAMNQLDPDRRNFLVHLLYDTQLITYHSISDKVPITFELANLTNLCLVDGSLEQQLTHISLEGALMTKADFIKMNLQGAIFNRAILNKADFSNTTNYCFIGAKCPESTDPRLYFLYTDLTDASFFGSIYENVTFEYSKMKNINLNSIQCYSCLFSLTDMEQANLRDSIIVKSSFLFTKLTKANFNGSEFSDDVYFYGADMGEIRATHTRFTQCDFQYASIRNAIFDYTTIKDSTFERAQLFRTSMKYSVLIKVNFKYADLREANWQNARCEKCIFQNADFNSTHVSNAMFIDCDFQNSTITKDQLKQAASLNGSILPYETTN